MPIQPGTLLISEPYMGDSNFERSVVLVCEHNNKGSFGLVLNNPTAYGLGDVMDISGAGYSQMLYVGGPVEQNTLHFIHKLGNEIPGSLPLKDGLYWSGSFETLKAWMDNEALAHNQVRFFLGYSGWAAGQLEAEVNDKSWVVANIDVSSILDITSDDIWRHILRQMGGEFKQLSNYPVDPRLN